MIDKGFSAPSCFYVTFYVSSCRTVDSVSCSCSLQIIDGTPTFFKDLNKNFRVANWVYWNLLELPEDLLKSFVVDRLIIVSMILKFKFASNKPIKGWEYEIILFSKWS